MTQTELDTLLNAPVTQAELAELSKIPVHGGWQDDVMANQITKTQLLVLVARLGKALVA